MLRHLVRLGVLVLLLVSSFSGVFFAQEEEIEEINIEEEIKYSWGTVKKISSDQIVVSEWDDEGEKVNVPYTVDPNVKLENVKLLKDIAAGDSLEIDYVVRDGKKIAKVIVVGKLSEAEKVKEEEKVEEELE